MLEKVTGDAKLGKRITPHSFRRTFANNLLKKGVNLHTIKTALIHKRI